MRGDEILNRDSSSENRDYSSRYEIGQFNLYFSCVATTRDFIIPPRSQEL
jgi:hypothetical protein